MSTTKHTPGPWRAVIDSDFTPGIDADDIGESIVVIGPNNLSTDLGIWGRCREEAEANAHLIAAAPDLLAALQTLVEQAERHDAVGLYWDQARAAIAKAEGSAK